MSTQTKKESDYEGFEEIIYGIASGKKALAERKDVAIDSADTSEIGLAARLSPQEFKQLRDTHFPDKTR